jgi:hypothetical protein
MPYGWFSMFPCNYFERPKSKVNQGRSRGITKKPVKKRRKR